ncbi:MAG: hypothetical protein J7527_01715 [Chitinophagaceae bacterium]|nr:hypothetical protein [Chitinophagaceae bacterium]
MKKEIPILFSTPMVEAILAGRKTQTRRIMKPQIQCNHYDYTEATWQNEPTKWSTEAMKETGHTYCVFCGNGMQYGKGNDGIRCPYGKPGDILYVRESWRLKGFWFEEGEVIVEYADGKKEMFVYDEDNQDWVVKHWEKLVDKGIIVPSEASASPDATDEDLLMEWAEGVKHPFKPNIHLPTWLSRIWLEVIDVRVERLNDITDEDAVAEGVETLGLYPGYKVSPKGKFEGLWNSINGPESWDANPWVWVIEFKVLSTTGKPELS